MLAIWNDPDFIRHVGDREIRTGDHARDALRTGALKLYSDFGYGPYRLGLRDSDEAIGICGLFKREHLDDPDIGYALLPDYAGRGYAFEAGVAARDHARDHMQLERLVALISPGNALSIRLIEKLGFSFEGPVRMPGEDEDVSLYGLNWHQDGKIHQE